MDDFATFGGHWSEDLHIHLESDTMVSRLSRIDKSACHCFLNSQSLSIPLASYFVRIGSLAEIRVVSGPVGIARNDQVIIRASSGTQHTNLHPGSSPQGNVQHGNVQHGNVLRRCTDQRLSENPTWEILRVATSEDRMLIRRLNRHKHKAVEKCREALAHAGSQAILLDIDPCFDGRTLILHFLGTVDSIAESISERFAAEYEAVAQIRHFEKLLRDGCGPTCGTEAGGCAHGACGSCSAAVACQPNAS